ncbi:TonB-dependent receptor [Pseudoalteromonas sp. JBTF-M23]|uniref:TonB-dependent receptor n=1 Tax=Pseudoalteromonas caenipelagi TaxID=2726988 RepID=A0A849VDK6_9GAMM|nr:TonB-dependent receptor [Pseudoalteromonas caenipelagi]
MLANNFKKSLLAVNVGLVLSAGISGVAVAAENNQVKEDVEVIEVRGIRRSLEAALNTKRFANAVVDSVSAEDIGKFPDKNIAESLQRVAGVSINRGFVGEGSEVSIRGVDPTLTQVQLNGQFVASTGWFSQAANRRSFNMDLMPSEMIAGLEVYKSPVASIDEGGVGGTVVMRTRKPLELDANTFFGSVEANQNSLADETGFGATGLASWKNDSETFGVLVMASQLEQIGRARKSENYWEEGWSASGIAGFDQDRERTALDVTFQYAPSDELELGAHFLRTELDAFNTNQNFLTINGTSYVNGSGRYTLLDAGAGDVEGNRRYLKGTVTEAGWLAQDTNTRNAVMKSNVVDFTASYMGENYKLSGAIGKTWADGGNGGNANGLWGQPVDGTNGITVDIDMDLANSMVMVPNGVSLTDTSWQANQGASLSKVELEDEETYAQIDLDLDVDWGAISQFEAGIKVRNHEFTAEAYAPTFKDGAIAALGTIADFADGNLTDFNEVVTGGTPTSYTKLNGRKYWNYLNSNVQSWDFQEKDWNTVEEKVLALYAQGNFSGDSYRGNIGVRYVQTDTESQAYNGLFTGKDVFKGDYSDWLPSFNLALDLQEDVILRMSAAKVMTRAGYSQLAGGYSGLPDTVPASGRLQASRGNPAIEPFRATQMDIGLEWYYDGNSLVSFALFNKDVASFITTIKVDENLTTVPVPGNYEVSIPDQGRGGKIEGAEFQWQTNFGNGFGALFNYTYVDATGQTDDGKDIQLPGSSRNAFNLTGYYESDMFTARLAYTSRDEFFAEGTALGNGNDSFDSQSFLDASFTWHATENFDVSLEGVNLTNEITYQRFGGGLNTLRVVTDNGSRYSLKASYRF